MIFFFKIFKNSFFPKNLVLSLEFIGSNSKNSFSRSRSIGSDPGILESRSMFVKNLAEVEMSRIRKIQETLVPVPVPRNSYRNSYRISYRNSYRISYRNISLRESASGRSDHKCRRRKTNTSPPLLALSIAFLVSSLAFSWKSSRTSPSKF